MLAAHVQSMAIVLHSGFFPLLCHGFLGFLRFFEKPEENMDKFFE
jgi:hypothetical protein